MDARDVWEGAWGVGLDPEIPLEEEVYKGQGEGMRRLDWEFGRWWTAAGADVDRGFRG